MEIIKAKNSKDYEGWEEVPLSYKDFLDEPINEAPDLPEQTFGKRLGSTANSAALGLSNAIPFAPDISGLSATLQQKLGLMEDLPNSENLGFNERWKRNTDIVRDMHKEASEENPALYTAGTLGGMVATPGAGAKAATLAGKAGAGALGKLAALAGASAAEGGLYAYANSDKRARRENVPLEEIASGALAGAILPVGMEGVKNAVKWAGNSARRVAGRVSEEGDKYIQDNYKRIIELGLGGGEEILNEARTKLSKITDKQLSKGEGLGRKLYEGRQALQKEISEGSSAAYETLRADKNFSLDPAIKEGNKILSRGLVKGENITPPSTEVVNFISKIKNISAQEGVNEFDAKALLKNLDAIIADVKKAEKGVYKDPVLKDLFRLRGALDLNLKAQNNAYKEAMLPVAAKKAASNRFDHAFDIAGTHPQEIENKIKTKILSSGAPSTKGKDVNKLKTQELKKSVKDFAATRGDKSITSDFSSYLNTKKRLKKIEDIAPNELSRGNLERLTDDLNVIKQKPKTKFSYLWNFGRNDTGVGRTAKTDAAAREKIATIEKLTGMKLLEDLERLAAVNQVAKIKSANGSRNVNLYKAGGEALGDAVASLTDPVTGQVVNKALGAAGGFLGSLRDYAGPKGFMALHEYLNRYNSPTTQKWLKQADTAARNASKFVPGHLMQNSGGRD